MIPDLKKGDFVYIRAEFQCIGETGKAWVRVRDPKNYSMDQIPIPVSQVVCREPPAIFVNAEGLERPIEHAEIADKVTWE